MDGPPRAPNPNPNPNPNPYPNPSPNVGLLAQLVEGGLLMPGEELAALQQCSSLASSTPISIAYGWSSSRL